MSNSERAAMYFALFRLAHWPYFGYPRGFVVGKKVGRPFQAVENDVNANDGLSTSMRRLAFVDSIPIFP